MTHPNVHDWKFFNCECKFYKDFKFHQLFNESKVLDSWIDETIDTSNISDTIHITNMLIMLDLITTIKPFNIVNTIYQNNTGISFFLMFLRIPPFILSYI